MSGGFTSVGVGFINPSGAFVAQGGLGLSHPPQDFALGGGGVLPFNPTVDLNFASNAYYGVSGAPTSFLTTVRAAPAAYASDVLGNWISFGANIPRITNAGLLVEESRTNLFLNSQAPVTQTITVTSSSVYTVSVYGNATLVLSGAGTGTVTQGNPVTFTASSTSLTVTVSGAGGSFQNAQVELGAFATSPIVTAGAAGTRAGDVIVLTSPPAFGSAYTVFGSGTPKAPNAASANQFLLCVDDGTGNNRVNVNRNSTGLNAPSTQSGGVLTSIGLGTAWAQNMLGKNAISVASGAQASSFNGGAVDTAAGALPVGVANTRIGTNQASVAFWDGTISRVALWATSALTGAQLQQITT
jgi:hypothetical protein